MHAHDAIRELVHEFAAVDINARGRFVVDPASLVTWERRDALTEGRATGQSVVNAAKTQPRDKLEARLQKQLDELMRMEEASYHDELVPSDEPRPADTAQYERKLVNFASTLAIYELQGFMRGWPFA